MWIWIWMGNFISTASLIAIPYITGAKPHTVEIEIVKSALESVLVKLTLGGGWSLT